MAATVSGQGAGLEVGSLQPLFAARPAGNGLYDVSPDGQRFLVNSLVEQAASAPITVVVNWTALLKK